MSASASSGAPHASGSNTSSHRSMTTTNTVNAPETTASSSSMESSSTAVELRRRHACLDLLAGDTPVTVVPSFDYGRLGLISRPVGPFVSGMETTVPLWLALVLRRKGLAVVRHPDWLQSEYLRKVLEHERDPTVGSFSEALPRAYAEIARALLWNDHNGGDDDNDPSSSNEVRTLLEDIATVRTDKIRRNVHTLSANTLGSADRRIPVIDVTGIGSVEVAAIRPFLTTAFRDHDRLMAPPPSSQLNGTKQPQQKSTLTSSNARTGAGTGAGAGVDNQQESEVDREEEDEALPSSSSVAPQPNQSTASRIRRYR